MRVLLRILLLLQGFAISALSVGVIVMGPSELYSWVANMIGLDGQLLEGVNAHFIDGSMRFYAVFVLVFGLVVLNVARDFRDNFKLIPILMLILIIAGCARLWSTYTIGDTNPFTMVLALAEILPAILILMIYLISGKQDRY